MECAITHAGLLIPLQTATARNLLFG